MITKQKNIPAAVFYAMVLGLFIIGLPSVSTAQSQSNIPSPQYEKFLLCEIGGGKVTPLTLPKGWLKCCKDGTCAFVDTPKSHTKADLKSKFGQPVMPIAAPLAPAKVTSPRKHLKPTVIAPSNRLLSKPSVITPSNKAITKPTVIVPNNRTIKKTATRTVNSAIGTSADREASKPSISNIK